MRSFCGRVLPLALLAALPSGVIGGNVLSTDGFSQCANNPTVKVQTLNVQYDRTTRQLVFDIAGVSTEVQKVEAELVVSAYGKTVYTKSFNPCDTGMKEMCPRKCPDNFSFHMRY